MLHVQKKSFFYSLKVGYPLSDYNANNKRMNFEGMDK
jgi:hypothetical protein